MIRAVFRKSGWVLNVLLCALPSVSAQQQSPSFQFTEAGHIEVNGHSTPFLIRHLPVSSFPQLPAAVQNALNQRGCIIPQTYEAHAPENVVAASLARRGSADWAVLCSEHGMVSLLVFFAGGAAQPTVLASAPETERLAAHGADGVLGFDWGIDVASPAQVHEAQSEMKRRPPLLDHDALADSRIEQTTVYHYFSTSGWTVVQTQE
jgi:hypothetical protein